jgi:hypothetical protein
MMGRLLYLKKKSSPSGVDRSHGSPYDRGGADAYYWRDPNPHKWPDGDHTSPVYDLTGQEIEEYLLGYRTQYDSGIRKDWGDPHD